MFGQCLGVAEVIRNVDVVTNRNRLTNKSVKEIPPQIPWQMNNLFVDKFLLSCFFLSI